MHLPGSRRFLAGALALAASLPLQVATVDKPLTLVLRRRTNFRHTDHVKPVFDRYRSCLMRACRDSCKCSSYLDKRLLRQGIL